MNSPINTGDTFSTIKIIMRNSFSWIALIDFKVLIVGWNNPLIWLDQSTPMPFCGWICWSSTWMTPKNLVVLRMGGAHLGVQLFKGLFYYTCPLETVLK